MTALATAFRLREGKPEPLPPIHLQGMGLMGSLVGQYLLHYGTDFTWSDNDSPTTAWKACTGVVYPSGHLLDNENLELWQANPWCCRPWRERGQWTHYSHNPPHGGRLTFMGKAGGVRVANAHTVHVNAQRMVEHLRGHWGVKRTSGAGPSQLTIVTHGFDERTIHRWSWGWSARVELWLSDELKHLCTLGRPALYMRDGYLLDYAYPVPGNSAQWYAGTGLYTQRKPKSLNAILHFETWCRRFLKKCGGAVRIERAESPVHGWRPVPNPDEKRRVIVLSEREWAVVPQYGSALRHWWSTASELLAMLVTEHIVTI